MYGMNGYSTAFYGMYGTIYHDILFYDSMADSGWKKIILGWVQRFCEDFVAFYGVDWGLCACFRLPYTYWGHLIISLDRTYLLCDVLREKEKLMIRFVSEAAWIQRSQTGGDFSSFSPWLSSTTNMQRNISYVITCHKNAKAITQMKVVPIIVYFCW